MNTKRYLMATVAVFVFIFLYEWFFHEHLMKEMYMSTSELWRTHDEMHQRFIWLVIGQLFYAAMFCCIFIKGYENKGLMEGVRYGILIGLLMVGPHLIMYAVAPYTVKMVAMWIGGFMVEMIGAGAVLSLVYKSA